MRKSVLLIIGLLLIACSASALSLDFQNPNDYNSMTCISTAGYCEWTQSAIGQNSYVTVTEQNGVDHLVTLSALPFTYAAVDLLTYGGTAGNSFVDIVLYDSGMNILYTGSLGYTPATGRYQVNMIGGQAHISANGAEVLVSPSLSVNPSHIGIGSHSVSGIGHTTTTVWDNLIVGSTDSPYIFGMPEQNIWELLKDITIPANSGFASYTGTVVNNHNMTTTWAKNNGLNEIIYLANTDTGVVYQTATTGSAYTGSVVWDIDPIINTGTFGRYRTYSSNGTGYSNSIWFVGSGASVAFNSHTYSQGETATITYSVTTAAWDPATYNYRIRIIDIYGTEIDNVPLIMQSGTISYTWTTANAPNVYYVLIEEINKATSVETVMNFDYTTLNAYTSFSGTTYDAFTGLTLPGVVVNVSQGSSISNTTSDANASYSTSGAALFSGVSTLINATYSGYEPYQAVITPMRSGSIPRDISLWPLSANVTGLGIGGIAQTGTLGVGINITGGYGQPIPFAPVMVQNVSTSQYYIKTTNVAGGYICDEGAICFLIHNFRYSVWGSKTGYSNSSVYTVVP